MEKSQIKKIIQSTVPIAMLNPGSLMPEQFGSGTIIRYNGIKLLLTVAHVTNIEAATCIDMGEIEGGQSKHWSVGAMNYLEQYDFRFLAEQVRRLSDPTIRPEHKNFGLIDFCYVKLPEELNVTQRRIYVSGLRIKKGYKTIVETSLLDFPMKDEHYGFGGRINIGRNKQFFNFYMVFYSGLKFIEQIGNYYTFELPKTIQRNIDFQGTSGAPIMDTKGRVVSLISHGYIGEKRIFGISLPQFKVGIDTSILNGDL